MAKFRSNLGQFWSKRAIFKNSQKSENVIFSTTETRLKTKKLASSKEWITRKMRKTTIFGHFAPNRTILDNFWPKWAKREFFSKK